MQLQPRGDRIASQPAAAGALGEVIAVSGSRATVGIFPTVAGAENVGDARVTVSKFVLIHGIRSRLVGLVTSISLNQPAIAKERGYCTIAEMDLMGEIRTDIEGSEEADVATGTVGRLLQDPTVEAHIHTNEMLSKHFAVLGTTGVGKSSAVMTILREVLEAQPDLRIFLLDAHNEYARCFGDQSLILNLRNLRLPFWLFNFEEIVDVFFGGRAGNDAEIAILAEVIPLAKTAYLRYRSDRAGTKRADVGSVGYTSDTPVPYMLADLIALIDERMGKLENRATRMIYYKLISRIETVRNDPRYAFMFENANVGGDTLSDVITQLFRLVPEGKPLTVMQLAGFPAEVVDAVVSVLGRMAFDFGLWSDGAFPLLFVCEEAHRYASADRNAGFGPTRRAFSRIAKEGRKYGVFLGLVSQRPAEIDPTILSQCSTLFIMRLSNERDQAILRSAVSDAAACLLDFVPSLGTGEAFVFGEGVAMPTRLRFDELPPQLRPRNDVAVNPRTAAGAVDPDFIAAVIERWRGAIMVNKLRPDGQLSQNGSPADVQRKPLTSQAVALINLEAQTAPSIATGAGGLNEERFNILRKAIKLR
jgi:DNA helicase HerA-like ATPase